jgi:hypothetical protein
MNLTIELYEFKNICMDMAELGAANYAKRFCPAKDNMSQREAYRTFGETRVRNWVRRGVVRTIRSGETKRTKILYSYAELRAMDTAEKMNIAVVTNHELLKFINNDLI